MKQNSVNLFNIPFEDLFERIKNDIPSYSYNFSRHVIQLLDLENNEMGHLRLPLHLEIDEELTIMSRENSVLYLSLESGNAAIIVIKGKELIYHTTFSAYMSRKKQGFSQIKYLKKKGKSRAGSRVRLAASTEFFENINLKSTELLELHKVKRIALNCNTTLMPFLFQSKTPPPFDKKDSRLYKIPLHIPQSNFTNLHAAIKQLMAPILFFDIIDESALSPLFE